MVEMAEIFRRYGPQYRAKYGDKMLPSHKQAMRAIEQCRTAALGGHVYTVQSVRRTSTNIILVETGTVLNAKTGRHKSG